MEVHLNFTRTGRLRAGSRRTLRAAGQHYCRVCDTIRSVVAFYRRSDGAPLDACKACHKGRVTAAKQARV